MPRLENDPAGGNAGGNKFAIAGEAASKADSLKRNKKRTKTLLMSTVDRIEYTRRDSNPQPSVPKTDALSS